MFADSGQPLIFSPETFFQRNDAYNEEANEIASGFGLGMDVYDAPGMIAGSTQIPIDLSTQTITPQVVFSMLSNPQWLLVIAVVVLILIMFKKRSV